ncbi:MAG: hypothetical protein ABSB41_15170 [Anaerolineales bacterium]|jgi:hypothetical protein
MKERSSGGKPALLRMILCKKMLHKKRRGLANPQRYRKLAANSDQTIVLEEMANG